MKNKYSFTDILIIIWAVVLPTIMSTLIVVVYLEELDKITFIDNTLMKIAYVVSVLHLVIMLGIVMSSIINDIKEIKKIRFYRKHPEEREKDKQKTLDEYKKLFEELDKKINEEKEKNKNEKTNN
ncbi:MAG: hypothetical protein WC927_05925 [Bacilli bacterium]|jgi:heme/copper-type cytochrome/quinol oxidase subunit 2